MKNVLEIVFWGVRGSLPVSNDSVSRYGGNTSCVEVIADNGTRIVFDGGSGIYPLGNKYLQDGFPEKLAVFITHSHWDHIQGLPFFAPAYIPGNKISFYGCHQGALPFSDVLKKQMESPFFPIELSKWSEETEIKSIGETKIDFGGVCIESAYVDHPGMTFGFKLTYKGKKIVYVPDNELFANFPQDRIFVKNYVRDAATDIETVILEEHKKKFFDLIGSADVLIHDAQYTPDEYQTRLGWGHSSFDVTVRAALYADVKHLVLFHYDPSRTDDSIDEILKLSEKIILSEGGALKVSAASEHLVVKL